MLNVVLFIFFMSESIFLNNFITFPATYEKYVFLLRYVDFGFRKICA